MIVGLYHKCFFVNFVKFLCIEFPRATASTFSLIWLLFKKHPDCVKLKFKVGGRAAFFHFYNQLFNIETYSVLEEAIEERQSY